MAFESRVAQLHAQRARIPFMDMLGAVVVIGWAVIAFIFRSKFYDNFAIFASVALLAGGVLFYRWAPSPGRESFRLLGFFVCVQAFLTSGISVLNQVDVNPVLSTPTEEAFSAAVESTAIFAGMFLLAALVTAPRKGQSLADPPTATSGPTPVVNLVLAGLTALITMGLLTRADVGGVFGTLPLIFVNIGIIAPMLAAQPWLTGAQTRWAQAILLLGQAVAVFYSSMLGSLILPMRDMLLARVYLRTRLPLAFVGAMIALAVVLNPIKHLYRESAASERGSENFDTTMSLWSDAAATTWSSDSRSYGHQTRLESSSARLDYNWISAHVFRTVPRRLPFEYGATYAPIATILIPRIIYPDKPDSSEYGRGKWMMKLGVQTRQATKTAAFALPAPAEAYWNFGWTGVFVVPLILGFLVGLMLRWAPKDPVLRAGYVVLCSTQLGQFLDMVIWIVPAFVAVGASTLATVIYCRIGRDRGWIRRRPDTPVVSVVSSTD